MVGEEEDNNQVATMVTVKIVDTEDRHKAILHNKAMDRKHEEEQDIKHDR